VEAHTKGFPLSDWTWRGHPFLDTKRAKAARNFSVVKSDVGSRKKRKNENQHIPFCNKTSSSGIILYIKQAGVIHPCVRERTGKRHSLFWKISHHLDLQSLFVDDADLAGVNHCPHQVLYSRNPVSGPGETHH